MLIIMDESGIKSKIKRDGVIKIESRNSISIRKIIDSIENEIPAIAINLIWFLYSDVLVERKSK